MLGILKRFMKFKLKCTLIIIYIKNDLQISNLNQTFINLLVVSLSIVISGVPKHLQVLNFEMIHI